MIDKFKVEIEMDQVMCGLCKKRTPEYYELKLQIRCLFFDDIDVIKDTVFNIIDKNFNSINKFSEIDNGFDFFFRSKNEMNRILNLFNRRYLIESKKSKKILGQNSLESKSIWRYSLLMNIINLEKGDLISIKGEKFNIKAINKTDLVLINELNGNKKVLAYKLVKDYFELIKKKKDINSEES